MPTCSLTWIKQILGKAGALMIIVAVLLAMVTPICADCHEDEPDHKTCAAVHGCCTTHVPALASISSAFPIKLNLNSALLTGDTPSTGVIITDAPFHPPRA
jgi:hypothetical protein